MTPLEREIVAFPLVPQSSQRASAKRKKLFQDSLAKAAAQSTVTADQDQHSAQQSTGSRVDDNSGAPTRVASDKHHPPRPSPPDFASISNGEQYLRWLHMLQSLDFYDNQIVHIERRPPRAAQLREIADLHLPDRVQAALAKCNIRQLYSHQFAAMEALLKGENVVLSTSTASGKSLAYNVPMLTALLEEPESTFLYMFPTKVRVVNVVCMNVTTKHRLGNDLFLYGCVIL